MMASTCVGDLLDNAIPGIAGVVDDDVEAAEVVDGGLDEPLRETVPCHTADTCGGPPALGFDGGNRLLGRFGVEVVDYDRRPSPRTSARSRADAAAGARDYGYLSVELTHDVVLPYAISTTASPVSVAVPSSSATVSSRVASSPSTDTTRPVQVGVA